MVKTILKAIVIALCVIIGLPAVLAALGTIGAIVIGAWPIVIGLLVLLVPGIIIGLIVKK